ncbi:hypothetical protein N7497_000004 [Penicillium chrysogenum]|nr:hypothetical protein N7497_000004 [Penicillium chrysogenum]
MDVTSSRSEANRVKFVQVHSLDPKIPSILIEMPLIFLGKIGFFLFLIRPQRHKAHSRPSNELSCLA